jgi:hypothetical protein
VWPCTGLRTSNGEVFAHRAPEVFGHDGKSKVLQLSFPRLIDGKPLISSLHENINASDVLYWSKKHCICHRRSLTRTK